MSKPESKIKDRFAVFRAENKAPGIPWSDVARHRADIEHVVYELVEVGRGYPAELAALPDPDAPKIEVVANGTGSLHMIRCGSWRWDVTNREWTKQDFKWSGHGAYHLHEVAALLTKFKHYPQAAGGAQ